MDSRKKSITIRIKNNTKEEFKEVNVFDIENKYNFDELNVRFLNSHFNNVFLKLLNSIQFDNKDFRISKIILITDKETVNKKLELINCDIFGCTWSSPKIFKTDDLQENKDVVDSDCVLNEVGFFNVYLSSGLSIIIDKIEPEEKLTMVIYFN